MPGQVHIEDCADVDIAGGFPQLGNSLFAQRYG
jgi:hypothetical protein